MAEQIVLYVDPAPIPLARLAKQMGCSPETLIARRAEGFPLYKDGGRWYANPLDLLLWKRNGDETERRILPGPVPPEGGACESVEGGEPGGGGGEEGRLPKKHRRSGAAPHPLDL
jgi:hypothetical protein